MIIVHITGGVGNQLFQYAVARRLSIKHNTELKLDLNEYKRAPRPYRLDRFNITAPIATPDDMKRIEDINATRPTPLWQERGFMPQLLDSPDDVHLFGYYQSEKYFLDVEDIIRKELTIKPEFLGDAVKRWLDKIDSVECAVSLHIRHGDYMNWVTLNGFGAPSLEYYSDCINELRKYNDCFTLFVFSDHIAWAKENLHFGFPMEFVDDCESEIEELFLMSQCRHNIIPNSTFGWWGAWLNAHRGKKVLAPNQWFRYKDTIERIPETWIKVPVDYEKIPQVNAPLVVSSVIHVDGDLDATKRTLALLPEKRNWRFEFILVSNAVGRDVVNLCWRKANDRADIRFIRLDKKVDLGTVYNIGLSAARGMFVNFISSGDQIDLKQFWGLAWNARLGHMLHSVRYSIEAEDGSASFNDVKYNTASDKHFFSLTQSIVSAMTAPQRAEALAARNMSTALGANFFSRDWLVSNNIRFRENLGAGVGLVFLIECLLRAGKVVLSPSNFFFTREKSESVITNYEHDHAAFLSELVALSQLMDMIPNVEERRNVERLFVENYWFNVEDKETTV